MSNNRVLFATGCSSAAVQILYLREYLSVFSGNELTIGLIFALWLLAAATGSRIGKSVTWPALPLAGLLYVVAVIAGFLLLRASRLLFEPGEMIAPWFIPLIILVTQTDAAFFGGMVYGKLAEKETGWRLYIMENVGTLAGLCVITYGITRQWPNGVLAGIILSIFIGVFFFRSKSKRVWIYGAVGIFFIAGFLSLDQMSVLWKYPGADWQIQNGYEGEIALKSTGEDTLIYLNNSLYNNKISLPGSEQTVHVPAAMRKDGRKRALVIGDQGFVQELNKYPEMEITCIESEKALADLFGCAYGTIDKLRVTGFFDIIVIAGVLPGTAQTCRYYTKSFFEKAATLAGESGIVSFTLPFNENFLSANDKALKNSILRTLKKVFAHTIVVPGTGFTFCASNAPLIWPIHPTVKTRFLEHYTLAALDEKRLIEFNTADSTVPLTTIARPYALYLSQKQWLGVFGSTNILYLMVGAILLVGLIVLIKSSRVARSIGTTGFVTGIYSVALMIAYQLNYGSLYTDCSLLLIALTVGFIAGSWIRRFRFSDSVIGIYSGCSLLLILWLDSPGMQWFLAGNFGMGFLASSQFVSRPDPKWNTLYAADLIGGMVGMMVCSSILLPYCGMVPVACGLIALKIVIGIRLKNL